MMVCLVNLVLPRSIQGPTHSCSNDSNGHSNFSHENRLYDFCHDFDYNFRKNVVWGTKPGHEWWMITLISKHTPFSIGLANIATLDFTKTSVRHVILNISNQSLFSCTGKFLEFYLIWCSVNKNFFLFL